MDDNAPLEPTSESWVDKTHGLAVAATNAMTLGVGGTIMAMIVGPPAARRRQEFEREVAERIDRLEAEDRVTREKLQQDEQFISTYLHATLAAVRTHEQEKREALRNAVLNSALPRAPDDTRQQIFVNWIDELTPLHMRVVEACRRETYRPGQLERLLNSVPNVHDSGLAAVLESDLVSRNLIKQNRTAGVVYLQRNETWITPLGAQFLAFIADPLEGSEQR